MLLCYLPFWYDAEDFICCLRSATGTFLVHSEGNEFFVAPPMSALYDFGQTASRSLPATI